MVQWVEVTTVWLTHMCSAPRAMNTLSPTCYNRHRGPQAQPNPAGHAWPPSVPTMSPVGRGGHNEPSSWSSLRLSLCDGADSCRLCCSDLGSLPVCFHPLGSGGRANLFAYIAASLNLAVLCSSVSKPYFTHREWSSSGMDKELTPSCLH